MVAHPSPSLASHAVTLANTGAPTGPLLFIAVLVLAGGVVFAWAGKARHR